MSNIREFEGFECHFGQEREIINRTMMNDQQNSMLRQMLMRSRYPQMNLNQNLCMQLLYNAADLSSVEKFEPDSYCTSPTDSDATVSGETVKF